MAVMAPSRTNMEQTVLEGTVEGRGSAMDFSTGSEVSSDDVQATTSSTKSVHAPRFDVKTDAPQNQLDQLLELTDRYCVIFQTIQNSPKTTVKLNRVGQ